MKLGNMLKIIPILVVLVAASSFGQPQKYALIIGISEYPGFKKTPPLHYADEDARAFYEFIKTEAGGSFLENDIELLINLRAKRIEILEKIKKLSKARSNDLIYVFFSGHGVLDGLGRAYLMPYDSDDTKPEDKGFRADLFVEELRTYAGEANLIFFVDACRAGSVSTVIDAWDRASISSSGVHMAILSASKDQLSYEHKTLKQGLFTYFLKQGLEGLADGVEDNSKDGKITAGELFTYLEKKVSDYAKQELRQNQNPMKTLQFKPDFVLSVYNKQASTFSTSKIARKYFEDGYKEFINIRFKITQQTIDELDAKGVTTEIASKLTKLKNQEFKGENSFLDEIAKTVGENQTYNHRFSILIFSTKSQEHENAKSLFKQALEIDSTSADAHYYLALLLKNEKGQFDEAKKELDETVKIEPSNIKAWETLGDIRFESGDPLKALEAYKQARTLGSKNQEVEKNIAHLQPRTLVEKPFNIGLNLSGVAPGGVLYWLSYEKFIQSKLSYKLRADYFDIRTNESDPNYAGGYSYDDATQGFGAGIELRYYLSSTSRIGSGFFTGLGVDVLYGDLQWTERFGINGPTEMTYDGSEKPIVVAVTLNTGYCIAFSEKTRLELSFLPGFYLGPSYNLTFEETSGSGGIITFALQLGWIP